MATDKTKAALKERVKELTCLYEVSSIIGNSNNNQIEETFRQITVSIKKGFQYPKDTHVQIRLNSKTIGTKYNIEAKSFISSSLTIFNETKGEIIVYLNEEKFTTKDFLIEEQHLINNIATELSRFLERIEIQKNEVSLRKQMEHADRLSIIGEITAGIAHELNTPLANILGFAELLKPELENNKEANKDIDKIIKNAIFSREVVKKLMFFACKMPQEMKPINFVEVIKSAVNLLEATFRKEQVSYFIDINETSLIFKADTVQITQILFNLLINAIYFSPKNGLITIKAFEKDNTIILKILDEGDGLKENDLDKVFQPFYTTKPMDEGSGLGLSVVQGIVLSHKGKITAENNENKGAVFTVTLPKN